MNFCSAEKRRLQNIQRNNERAKQLGIDLAVRELEAATAKPQRPRRARAERAPVQPRPKAQPRAGSARGKNLAESPVKAEPRKRGTLVSECTYVKSAAVPDTGWLEALNI